MPENLVKRYDIAAGKIEHPGCRDAGKRQSLANGKRGRAERTAGRTDNTVLLMVRTVAALAIRMMVLEGRTHGERKILRE